MRAPVQCARRRVHMLCAPWSLHVHPVASFKCSGCRCIGRENQEGCCHGEYTHPSTMSAGEALDINTFELLCHLYSRTTRLACRPHIRHVCRLSKYHSQKPESTRRTIFHRDSTFQLIVQI